MGRRSRGIEVRPRSRKDLRADAKTVRQAFGVPETEPFPIMQVIELGLPELYDDFDFEVVPDAELCGREAETDPDRHIIRMSQTAYAGACDGVGRYVFTATHELGHLLEHEGEAALARNRRRRNKPPAYMDSEWQADNFAAELLMPFDVVRDMNASEIAETYGVSWDAAEVRVDAIRKELGL